VVTEATAAHVSAITRLQLPYRPPLDFAAMLAFLARRAIPGIELIDAGAYQRVVGTATGSGFIRVTADATQPVLVLEMEGIDAPDVADIVLRVRRLFDLDADLAAAARVLARDPLLARGLARRPGLRVPGGWDGFEVAVRAVLGQQVSVAGATTLARRLVAAHGTRRRDGRAGLDQVFPEPRHLATAAIEAIGLPKARAATVRALATAVLEQRISFRPGQELAPFVASLVALAGIGPWTAHYLAMRGLGQADAFPAGDLVLQKILGEGRRLSERETEARSQPWRPWRAYAVLHLWHLSGDPPEDA
jgi:AraC family transcriptional regulator of adaptative response / DNA-3-methyladenine glycosylase II